MIGAKKARPKAVSVLGALEGLKGKIAVNLSVGSGGQGDVNWDAVKAAKDLEQARQKFEVEKYRLLLRRY